MFKNVKILWPFLLSIIVYSGINAATISIVYSLKISETTKIISDSPPYHSGIGFTTFEQARWNRDGLSKSNAVGELLSIMYVKHPLYGRMDTAFARVSEFSNCKNFSRVQTDDVLLTGGYGWKFSHIRCAWSGLLGIPTHRDTSLEHIQFGLAHVGLGTQFDFSAQYLFPKTCFIRGVLRFIGTLPRRANLEGQSYNFHFGFLLDMLISHYARFGSHDVEFGYNPTFLLGTSSSPTILSLLSNNILIRNGCYATYGYAIGSKKILNVFRLGVSFSADILPKLIGQKFITTGWFVWAIAF